MALTLEELIANVTRMRSHIKVYLDLPRLNPRQTAALKTDLRQLDKNLAALEAYQPPVEATHVAELPVYDHVLTEAEEFEILIREQDKLLIAAGRPAGHEGAERGATTLGEVIDICEAFNLPILLAKYREMVVPGMSQ